MGNQIILLNLLFALLILFADSTVAAPVGVCYGRVASNLPPPSEVVNLIKSNGISRIRLFNPDPDALNPFSGTGIELMIGVPNEILPTLANGTVSTSHEWLQTNIFSNILPTQIRYLAVGNEVLLKDPFYSPYVVPAILNLYEALQTLGLSETIKLSSSHAASILSSSYPPSSGAFDPNIQPVLLPLLQFLQTSGSPLMVNVYPFFSYINNPQYISLDYALFRSSTPDIDQNLAYTNMFDATVDAFVYAMEKVGFPGIPVVVTETGWPAAGGFAASPENALDYNANIVKRTVNNFGTPKRPGVGIEVFLFDLFNENGKNGEEYERQFGIFGVDGTKAYDLKF
ncbi:glucan endo-1,3-beta-glucosidase-like [Olea europaea subsp. europaea]|uniref:Glucan endo-1,3-beta-glucosidase-like n=1 Tax=Olea europaea subsp. europaea TaxID=158383 RepID=A0A8S0S5H7_OLEEU|nr:glucan endo-1,3-beta-glucosidase-like [Olea europaea subsp. europaea]